MTTTESYLETIAREAYQTSKDHGWWDAEDELLEAFVDRPELFDRVILYIVSTKVALMHCELSEAIEEIRNNPKTLKNIYYRESDGKPEGFVVELIDAIIRILSLCGRLGLPVDRAMQEKLTFNKTRPHRHGGKAI